ncbi:MAG: ArsB/NhaD family transporter [Slackia sp.]|uniref:SLC13 family permease n=1 Tax=uncultured Slackia sp. TaxID=665903 RepID=UPI002805BE53|nr:ArsB/NhaD family transporter [uncultured Slackia sp.]MDU6011915.1 ArsB/NhaD family transporter [Slackia sp.]
MGFEQLFAIVVFVVAMILIMSEKVHRTVVALSGAMLLIIFHVMDFDTAIGHIDYNTLGVLFGMMLFVAVVRQSGLFEFLAIKTAKIAKGDPWRIMLLFALLTAVLSAFLDNVTTVLLIGPMTLTICEILEIDPIPFFYIEIMSSNIGGTATLIGDPPNIMLGSAAGYTFADFIAYDAPVVLVIMAALIVSFYVMFGRKMSVSAEKEREVMELEPAFEDVHLMKLSVGILMLVVVGFMVHGQLGIESSVVAITAAALILLLSRSDVTKALHGVEWTTLAFFAGLFIIVGGMVETGTISALANGLIDVTGGNVFLTMIVLVFASAVVSSFLDNIPFVATMIPILLAMEGTGMDVTPLWWAVSLGACLGGNGTLIGASANVVLSDISAKHGHAITFMQYLKIGFPMMVMSVAIAAIYLVMRFPA